MVQVEETEVISYNDTCDKTTEIDVDQMWQKILLIKSISHYIVFAMTLLTFIFGVASWCIIRKFRDYKNFVFLNTILANVLLYLCLTTVMANYRDSIIWLAINIFAYLLTVKNQWLVVICHMLYVDIVKVFGGHTRKRFLKSAIFSWILPLIPSGIFYCAHEYLFEFGLLNITIIGSLIFPIIVNCIFYLVIIFSICRSFNSNAHTAMDNWRRLYLATLIFICSDILLVTTYVITLLWPKRRSSNDGVAAVLQMVLYNMNNIILNIFFVTVRSNREIWREFYVKKINERSLTVRPKTKDINVHEIIICKPDTDGRSMNLDV